MGRSQASRIRLAGLGLAASVVLAALGSALAPVQAEAQSGDRVEIRGIDTSNFPEVVLDVQFAGPQLDHDSFVLREDGAVVRPLRVVFREQTDRAVAIVLALDRSGSMGESGALEQAKIAASTFVAEAGDSDAIGLVSFTDTVDVLVEPTTDRAAIESAIGSITVGDQTALWDAVSTASGLLAEQEADERYVIVISDIDAASYDNASAGTSADAIAAARAAGAAVLVVGLPAGEIDERELLAVSSETGGLLFYATQPTELEAIFREIQRSLSTSYEITFTSASEGPRAELLLTVQGSRAEASFEVPEPEAAPVADGGAGGSPVSPLLAVLVAVVVLGGGLVVLRVRGSRR